MPSTSGTAMPGKRDGQRGTAVPAEVAEIELQADDEQQQDQPKLAEHAEGFGKRRIEDCLETPGKK